MRRAAVPFGVALATGVAVAFLMPPHWRAPGLPYVLGNGKNVEHAAVNAALLAAALSTWLWDEGRVRRLLGLLAVGGFAAVLVYADPWALLASTRQLATVLGLFVALRLSVTNASRQQAEIPLPGRDLPLLIVAPALALLAATAFVVSLHPLDIDVYHHGEVLASAVDLVQGGRPFETFLWPHGFQDTGLTAVWIALTGKIGTSPVALAQSTCRALGVVSAFALALRLSASRAIALAAASGLVLALFVRGRGEGSGLVLQQLGVLVFVALGFAVLLAPKAEAWAGMLFALAHVFRLETGLYAVVAAVIVFACRDLLGEDRTGKAALLRLGSSVARLFAGAAAAFLLCRLALGWPGMAWLEYTLVELPRYHRDSSGFPFPWPLRDAVPNVPVLVVGMGLASLAFAVLLVIEAARRRHSSALWFMALFAALATRSSLDRSDGGHLLQWAALPLLAAILVATNGLRELRGWSALRTSGFLVLALTCLDLSTLSVHWPRPEAISTAGAELGSSLTLLREHLRPNPPVGTCRDTFFTPTESLRPDNQSFIEATCEAEGVLRAHHVTELVIAHSAPWYYVRFGLHQPTRYFAFARAYGPVQQRELIAGLRARRAQALLQVRGFAGIWRFDVPDAVRVPLIDAYLRERRQGVAPIVTAIGDFYFWDEPRPPETPRSPAGTAAPGVGIAVESVVYAPASGVFFANGWAADVSKSEPLKSLELAPGSLQASNAWASFEYGRSRSYVLDCGTEEKARCGFELAGSIPPHVMAAWQKRGEIDLTAVTSDGTAAPIELSLAKLQTVGELSGPEWRGLPQAVQEAAAQGASDRPR